MADKALIVEDDSSLANVLRDELRPLGYDVDIALDGPTGVQMALDNSYSFVLLDMNLPELEGTEVFKRIREQKRNLPIIMLSAQSDEMSKVLLLELGADDYITKPFNLLELKARIKTVVRRVNIRENPAPSDMPDIVKVGDLQLEFGKRKVMRGDTEIELTAREFDIVAMLISQPGRAFTRGELNEAVFGYDVSGYDRSINSHMNRIRSKLEVDQENPKYILTVRGVGYRFAELDSEDNE